MRYWRGGRGADEMRLKVCHSTAVKCKLKTQFHNGRKIKTAEQHDQDGGLKRRVQGIVRRS